MHILLHRTQQQKRNRLSKVASSALMTTEYEPTVYDVLGEEMVDLE